MSKSPPDQYILLRAISRIARLSTMSADTTRVAESECDIFPIRHRESWALSTMRQADIEKLMVRHVLLRAALSSLFANIARYSCARDDLKINFM